MKMNKNNKKFIRIKNSIANSSKNEIDNSITDFYIDEQKIKNIKAPIDMKFWVKEAIDRSEEDKIEEGKNKKRKFNIVVFSTLLVIIAIGTYNPVLAHELSSVQNILQKINDVLKIDEISSEIGIDKVIPKATLDKNGEIKFKKAPRFDIDNLPQALRSQIKNESQNEISDLEDDTGQVWEEETYIKIPEEDVDIPFDEETTKSLIHDMSNGIINAIDGNKVGYIEITPKTIDIAIESLQNLSNEEDRDYLREKLSDWKKGSFENGLDVHNYIWNTLGGIDGEAGSLNYNEINNIKENYFK